MTDKELLRAICDELMSPNYPEETIDICLDLINAYGDERFCDGWNRGYAVEEEGDLQ